jgi:DNA-binding MarR family transcriptional regulator
MKRPTAKLPSLGPVLRHWAEAVPEDRLAHLVKDAWRAYVRALQMRLTQHDVSFGHWIFLRVLWEHDGLTQRALSAEAGVMEPTTTAAVKALAKLGYVERRQASANKKNVYIHLTATGRALKRRLVPLAQDVNTIAIAGVPPQDVEATRRTLLAIIRHLARDEADSGSGLPSTRELARRITDAERAQRKRRPRKQTSAARRR